MPKRTSSAADDQGPERIELRERFEMLAPAFLALASRTLAGRGINFEDAEDIAQSALEDATAALDGFRGDSEVQLMRWFSTILHNQIVSFVRCDRRHRRVQGASLDPADYALPPAIDPETISEELSTKLCNAIDRLTPRQRVAIRCYFIEFNSLATVAQKLGVSVSAARMVKSRAIVRLHGILAKGIAEKS